MTLKAPFPYFGGKARATPLLWSRWGDVPNYVDPFCGSLAPLLLRPTPPRVETVNDADSMICNFWRAVQADPEAVAHWADWPVSELDLHARHRWLVEKGRARVERLREDPEFFDAKIAGWWVWGICQWIGSGWCADRASSQQMPALSRDGRGVRGLSRQLPHVGGTGRGEPRAQVAEQIPYLAGAGQGDTLPRQIPHLGGDSGAAGTGIHASAFDRRSGGLIAYMYALAERLRRVRIVCGNWDRVLGPSVTEKIGMTAILLDPPYGDFEHLYSQSNQVARDVRAWALEHGDNPMLRIALCGYDGEHTMPDSWECVAWKAGGGYAGQRKDRTNDNGARERIWFSPHCLKPDLAPPTLFDYAQRIAI